MNVSSVVGTVFCAKNNMISKIRPRLCPYGLAPSGETDKEKDHFNAVQ